MFPPAGVVLGTPPLARLPWGVVLGTPRPVPLLQGVVFRAKFLRNGPPLGARPSRVLDRTSTAGTQRGPVRKNLARKTTPRGSGTGRGVPRDTP